MNSEQSETSSELRRDALEPLESHGSQGEPITPAPSKTGRGPAWLALLLAMAAALGSAWLWWAGPAGDDVVSQQLATDLRQLGQTDSRLSSEVSDLRDAVESLSAVDTGHLGELDQGLAADRARLEQLQGQLQEQQALTQSLQAALDSNHRRLQAAESTVARLSARELNAREDLDLAEVDYLLRLASERLVLFADAAAADQALALADAHLASLDNPLYLGVRQAIAASRRDLAAVERPDAAAIAGRLDALQAAIPGLPFQAERTAATPDRAPVPEGWWAKLKATLASLVTVRRSSDDANARLSLADEDYLRQRLWLQLDLARLAAMRRDPDAYADALQRARSTTMDWFDDQARPTLAFLGDLDRLEALQVMADWPDISAPWQSLQLLRATPAVPAAPAAAVPGNDPAGGQTGGNKSGTDDTRDSGTDAGEGDEA